MPVIDGAFADGKYTVTIACATEGAEIHYTTDGTEPTAASTLYTEPFALTADCTVKAIAVKGEKTSTVSKFDAKLPWLPTSLGELYKAASYPKDFYMPGVKLTVAYASTDGKYVFLYDGKDYMLAYSGGGSTYKAGEAYDGVNGTVKDYSGLLELDPYTFGASAGTAAIPTPEATTIAAITTADMNRYVKLTNVTISGVSGTNGTLTDKDGKTIALFDRFKIENFANATDVNVTAFVSIYNNKLQLQPVDITTAGGEELVAKPTFDPASGAIVPANTYIHITAEEGATIMFRYGFPETIEDNEFATYSDDEVLLSAVGKTYTVEAYAIKDDVKSEVATATYTVEKASPELAWLMDGAPVEEVLYMLNGSENEQQLPYVDGYFDEGGDLAKFTSSNTAVATVNEWGEITIVGIGTTTITVELPETASYKAESASFVLNVYDKNAAGQIVATFDFSEAANITFVPAVTIASDTNIENSVMSAAGVEISFDGTNTSGVKLYNASGQATGLELRFYKGMNMIMKAPAMYEFSKVVFTPSYSSGSNFNIGLENGQAGTYDATTYTWEPAAVAARSNDGKVTELIFTANAASRIAKINIDLTNYITGVSDITVDNDAEAVYYNLQGVQVNNPAAGLYIRVQGNTATKVIIR